MGIFSKAEYRSVLMDYKFKESDGFPCIQATDGTFYCNAGYAIKTEEYSMWEDGRYAGIAKAFRESEGKVQIAVELKIKNGVPVDFKIDLAKLALTIGNKDIENLELCGWGFYDHPTDF
ncbi:MAG: hypothetical protein K6G43_07610 [Lachnospiraceae bacterium]|nr:hypothetical protein [Lachnospiraceae bacterium]MCR5739669.1 hypothetical protein [Lachnospiraceae bacterium]